MTGNYNSASPTQRVISAELCDPSQFGVVKNVKSMQVSHTPAMCPGGVLMWGQRLREPTFESMKRTRHAERAISLVARRQVPPRTAHFGLTPGQRIALVDPVICLGHEEDKAIDAVRISFVGNIRPPGLMERCFVRVQL